MSETLKTVLNRAMSDESFLQAFRANPEDALDEFDLSEDEREALLAGDEHEVNELLASPGSNGYTLYQSYSTAD